MSEEGHSRSEYALESDIERLKILLENNPQLITP